MKLIISDRVSKLVHYYNLLHLKYNDLPTGSLMVQLDDGYTGEVYCIEFEYRNGTFIMSCNKECELFYSVVYEDGTSNYGDITNNFEEISELIMRTMK